MGSLGPSQTCEPSLPLQYPPARRDEDVVDDYYGTAIKDPYRWLEDLKSDDVRAFVDAQAALTETVLAGCPAREPLRREITRLYDHPRYRPPFRRGERYFYLHNSGVRPQSVLYVQDGLDGEAEVLLDPNALSEDGTVALTEFAVSEDGEHLAYGLSASGSDWMTAKVMRVADREQLPDTLNWLKFTELTWTGDGKGFFYSRFPEPRVSDARTETGVNVNHAVYYHFLGSEQAADVLCWQDHRHPRHRFGAIVTDDGEYVVLEISESCDDVNKLYYLRLSSLADGLQGLISGERPPTLPFVKLIDDFDARYQLVASDGPAFTFITNKRAPRKKIVRVNVANEPLVWTDIVPEDESAVLESAVAVNGDQLLVSYVSDVKYKLQLRSLRNGELLHDLPLEIGTVNGVSGRRRDSEVFVSFTSFLTPAIIYRCDLTGAEPPELKIFREISIPGFDRSSFAVKQFFYASKDGTKVPMFIVSKKNIVLDGSHPTLLYGYGGFNVSVTPYFTVPRVVLMKNLGFVAAVANIRGGGEYGQEWHKAGSLEKKQNCFDDFIAAAEFLVSSGYTNPKKLCVEGASNGGLLVAACINQRPDLFGCALAHVGVMDMLRFHRFTIGHAWTSDFGCSANREQFNWLIKYSPLHNVRRPWEHDEPHSQYPSTMLLTADHDDRVVPLHTYKLLATMQHVLCSADMANSAQTNPIIARIERKSGHGCGRPTKKIIDEAADRYGFAAAMVGASWLGRPLDC